MDDDINVRAVAYLSLMHLGYRVTLAAHGFQAIEAYKQAMRDGQPYLYVFLDLTVPGGMGAIETFRRLKELDPEVIAVVATGYTNAEAAVDPAAHGFSEVMIKPYTVEDLARVLSRLPPRGGNRSNGSAVEGS
jgi:CheY-like chemotaxis protein